LSILVGPIFFILLRLTVEKGGRAAVYFSTGVWISDFLYMSFAYFGIHITGHIFANHLFRQVFGFGGSAVLLVYGLILLLSRDKTPKGTPEKRLRAGNVLLLFSQGFFVNSLNPFLLLFWIGVMAALSPKLNSNADFWHFAMGFSGTIITTDLIKIKLSRLISRRLRSDHILYMRRIGGLILMSFGLWLLLRTIVSLH